MFHFPSDRGERRHSGDDERASGSGAGSLRTRLRGGDEDRHVSAQRAAGQPEAAGASAEVFGVQEGAGHGQE